MLLLPLMCLLSPGFGPASAQLNRRPGVVSVSEGSDALLPCLLSPLGSGKRIEEFDWRKYNGEKEKIEVFMYKDGAYYGNGLVGQNYLFRDRIVFFKEEFTSGNASIGIKNTNLLDSGTYTCELIKPPGQRVNITLNVVGDLKIRNVPGAARKPHISVRDHITWKLLSCEVEGVPEPEVEWKNSAGKSLKNELTLNVTKSDNYTCVATQQSIYHQINNTMEVRFKDVEHTLALLGGRDAVLPCSVEPKENIENMEFSWSKDHKQVYSYNRGQVEKDGTFRGRLTHFQHELQSGNASIKIHGAHESDSGRYTCHFTEGQQSHVKLYVVGKEDKLDFHISHVILYVVALILIL